MSFEHALYGFVKRMRIATDFSDVICDFTPHPSRMQSNHASTR
ncbi:hypothetical protein RMSM_06908 [Rhodopirellula maiorica SM1]|uniref:Uncharacterized protein n=1 Tax=Rhodopirellula maiorica SM1 TaxID=1265738 RepID=M5RLB7_9BACT|nr:hypothetical protein RMSM_06908 [Rhodopirellula maiorica SM1]